MNNTTNPLGDVTRMYLQPLHIFDTVVTKITKVGLPVCEGLHRLT